MYRRPSALFHRGGGYWRFNPLLLTCIGSSAAMPVPLLAYDKPQLLAGAGDLSEITGNLGL